MAVLEKIRVKFGILITVLVALALLFFIIDPTTLNNFRQMVSNDNKVGEMAGKSISYKDFYQEFDQLSKIAEMSGQNVNDEQAQAALRDAAWQEIFDENVFYPAAKKAGIVVSDAEMYDLTQGSQISPVLLQQGMFADENGNFNRAALAQFIQTLDADETGNSAAYWDFLEGQIYKAQLYAKYSSLVGSSVFQNKVEKERAIKENNVTADVDYVMVNVPFEQDSTIKVTPDEVKAYYNARKENFKQNANRDIKYAVFEVVPSEEDINATKEEFDGLYEEFKTADNLKNFIALNSDAKWDTYYYKASQLESMPELKAIFNAGKEVTSEIAADGNSFMAARVADRAVMSDSAHVYYTAVALDQEAAADSILNVVRTKGASELQEIGWLTQEMADAYGIPELKQTLSSTDKALKIKVLNAQAWFIVYVAERTAPVAKVQFASFVKNIIPSETTYTDYMIKATELCDKAQAKGHKLAEVAEAENIQLIPAEKLTEDVRSLGQCENAREVIRWVFDKKTKVGSVSDVIVADNKYYFVATVDRIRKEGTVDLRDVAKDIRLVLSTEKKVAQMKDEVAQKIAGCQTIEDVAAKLGESVSKNTGVSFGSQFQQLDGKFVGALANAQEGKLTGPVAGEVGVYVFQVSNRTEGNFYSETDAQTAATQKGGFQAQMLQSVLSEQAKIKDNRARFF